MRRISGALGVLAFLLSSSFAVASDRYFGLLVGEAAWLSQAEAVALRTDLENQTRVIPLIGAGALQALQDITGLQNIDAAIVTADSLLYAQRQKIFNAKIETTTELAQLNLVLLTNNSIKNLTKLAGKRIATGPAQTAGFASGELVFGALEIPFLRVPLEGKSAVKALQDGSADAALVLLRSDEIQNLKFKVLPLPLPSQLSENYSSTSILVEGKKIETLSVSLQLITLHSNQNANVKKFQSLLNETNSPTIIPTGGKP
jgi:hypothetical protein